MLHWCISKPNLSHLFIIMGTNNNKIYLCFWKILESYGNLLAHAILTKCNQCAIDGWWWKNQAKGKGKWPWLTLTQWSIRLITNILYQGDCYHQPCSCLCEVDPGWIVEGQATKEVEPRLPRLPNGWLSHQSRRYSLCVIKVQDNNGGDPDQVRTKEIRARHQIKSNGLEVRKVKDNGNPRSMDNVTKWTKALD